MSSALMLPSTHTAFTPFSLRRLISSSISDVMGKITRLNVGVAIEAESFRVGQEDDRFEGESNTTS